MGWGAVHVNGELNLRTNCITLTHYSNPQTGSGYLGEWWNTIKVLWRYGYTAPTRTQKM